MPIIRANGDLALFIHVPKTGGTAIAATLAKRADLCLLHPEPQPGFKVTAQHMHGTMLSSLFPESFFSQAFMIVRHPVDRMISEYKYRIKIAQTYRAPHTIRIFGRRVTTHHEKTPRSFTKWLKQSLKRSRLDPFLFDNHLRPQVEFEAFNPIIYRFESGLEVILADMFSRLGLDTNDLHIPRANRSDGNRCEISQDDRELIESVYKCDFEKYGYR